MNSSSIFYWVDLFYLRKRLLGLKGSKNLERGIYNKPCCTCNFDAERLEGLMKTFFQKWCNEIKLKNVQCNCDTRNIAWMLTNIRFGIYPLKEFSTTNIASFWKQCKTLITLTDFKTKINPHSSKSKCEHALERIAPIWLRPLLIINLREVGNEKKMEMRQSENAPLHWEFSLQLNIKSQYLLVSIYRKPGHHHWTPQKKSANK